MTTQTEEYKLPNVIPVKVGVIAIPTRFEPDSLAQFESHIREANHLLALLPDSDKAEAEYDDNEIIIHTSNLPSLKYACSNYFLSDFFTTCHAVHELAHEHFDGEVCEDCIEELIDEALDAEYTSVVLSEGVFLKRGTL